jgi:D-3-phosphoglycerate dehydrogenase / 2-oxoglutarate reductase
VLLVAKVLVSDAIAQEGIEILQKGADVTVRIGISPEDLISIIGEYDALAVRSETKVTAAVLDAAKNLKIIGRAGVGVDNIDVPKATERGVLVVNSPEGNTIAAAELTVAMLLALARNIPQADSALRNGEWKRSKYTGVEVYNKTLGVIGLGKIGREVARRLMSFEMQVIAYDPFANAEMAAQLGIHLVDLPTLYKNSDYITLHVPKTKETAGMIGTAELHQMKAGVRLVNVARGGLIVEADLADALKSGHVAGAAIDVFSTEPAAPDNPLLGLPNVVHTPHLGASTEEAQVNVAVDIAEQIIDVLEGRPARAAVNMPALGADVMRKIQPFLVLSEKIGSLHAQLTKQNADRVEIIYNGSFDDLPTVHLTRAVLKGLLEVSVPESVNYVNSPGLAERRGIKLTESKRPMDERHSCQLTVRVTGAGGENREICGSVYGSNEARIVHIDGYRVSIDPHGYMLVTEHTDKPGIIGKVGTMLGDAGVNIAGMHVGREGIGKKALMILKIDDAVPDGLISKVAGVDGIESAVQVQL